MALPDGRSKREYERFVEDGSGNVAVRTVITGGTSSGTEYTEGDTDATFDGPVIMGEGPSDTATPLQLDASGNLKVLVGNSTLAVTQSGTWNINNISGTITLPTGAATAANQSTLIGHVDGIEALLTTIDADTSALAAVDYATQTTLAAILVDTGQIEALLTTIDSDTSSIATDASTIAGAVSGSEMQVDVITMPTVTTSEAKSSTATHSNVSGSATSVTLLSLNANRLGATVHNDSTANLYLKLGSTASTSSFTTVLKEDDYYEVPFGYTGVIDGIWSSATGAARVVEMTA